MSQDFAQLCALLVEDTYGPLYSHIFSTLITYGRLSTKDLSQKCQLHHRQVIAGLATLTQCLFVYHSTGSDGRTFYQANPSTAYNLIRVGRYTELIRTVFGYDGTLILSHLLTCGYDTADNLEKVPEWSKGQKRLNRYDLDEHTVALYDSQSGLLKSVRSLIGRLIEQEYLIELRPAHFQSLSDTRQMAEMTLRASGRLSIAKGKKGQEELENLVRAETERMLSWDNASGNTNINGKRKATEEVSPPARKKRKRANGVLTDGAEMFSEANKQQSQSIHRLNHTKLLSVLRHDMMAHRLQKHMGFQPGHVLAALLHASETRPSMEDHFQQSTASKEPRTKTRFARVDMDQLLQDVKIIDDMRGVNYSKHAPYTGQANGYFNGNLSPADNVGMKKLERQVAAIAEKSCDFILRDEEDGSWNIDVGNAEDRLRDEEIMQMVKRRFGLMSLRIIRILFGRGKVDEKALQEIGLVNAKDLRRCLAQLHTHGYVDLQEVPREPQRQPARTIYLWFYDSERVRRRVMENLYKSMCRLLQRLKVERQKVKSTLQKAERSDVKGREHEALRSDEIAVLKGWRRKEMWFFSELERLGSSVDILQ